MELTRRSFGRKTMAALVAVLCGAWHSFARAAPARWLRAVKHKTYPGKVRPLDHQSVRKPGGWLG